ncbi:zinc finger protein ZXDC isoform X2 [Syngnathoides biaculeatus]|uniref:zinc finger protein ZXDC isoform X2 n=1 Tax=Syngnathoides biaculeatus TaxID=300417 RepID=UPI002ADDB317|nr:zinc finger protein ZXDC isoform X2 [Syngnathoides biaculeatus]
MQSSPPSSLGGSILCKCYRDTKMEIQGLSHAENVHSQHGATRTDTSSGLGPVSGSTYHFTSKETEADLQSESPQFGNENIRSRTYLLHKLAEYGGEVDLSPVNKLHLIDKNNIPDQNETLGNMNTEQDNCNHDILSTSNIVHCGRRAEVGNLDLILQMAPTPAEGEEEPTPQHRLTLPFPLLPHRRGNRGSEQPSLAKHSTNGADTITSKESKDNTKELVLVFNVFKDDQNCDANKDGLRSSSQMKSWNKMKTAGPVFSPATSHEPMEVGNASNCHLSSFKEHPNRLDSHDWKNTDVDNYVNVSSNKVCTQQSHYYRTVEDVVLTNKYGEKICGQICNENSEGKASGELPFQGRNDELISMNSDIVETMEASQLILESARLDDAANSSSLVSGMDANETFSGTIMINNQTIIVTIENGTLTLAAPSDGYVHKEDDLVSLKEHLGVKEDREIVLLNYDSSTKAIGKISALACSSNQEEVRPGVPVRDSEQSLMDNMSLPTLSTSLHCFPIIKKEAGVLHEITEVDMVTSPKPTITNKHFKCGALSWTNNGIAVSFACPKMGCSCAFDTRQKLRVHLLNHAEDPRPYQCTLEGCGWAFATSYKLKRHLQSHNKQRPHTCHFEGCGRCFTTVYNLKAHTKVHEQDDTFICEICNERFRSAARLGNHQRVHFEPQRPHKCEFPGCEKTFITFSALYSHNRTHFRETGHFTCTYPGCAKMYDKACRLKIHLRSHTGERPFVCDSEGCGWSFTSMSKLLRHKRKHDDDRRFVCTEEGCGKSFTRAEHLKGHSITHLGTKPFHCHAEGCNAKFSARSSLYIHTKKHKQDASTLRTRCPVATCSKHFSSRSTLKSHMLKQHHLSPDVMKQMETTPTLTPSSELISPTQVTISGPTIPGSDQLMNLDLSSLFSLSGTTTSPAGAGVGIPFGGNNLNSSGNFTMDLSMVSSGILTVDPSTVGTPLCTSNSTTFARPVDSLILAQSIEMGPHNSLGGTVGDVLPPQGTLNLDDVQSVTPEALGTLTSLSMQGTCALPDPTLQHPLRSSSALGVEPTASLAVAPVSQLVRSPAKMVENGGSARTDYRAIQVAKRKKQICPSVSGSSGSTQRKPKGDKSAQSSAHYDDRDAAPYGGLNSVTGAQFVQIQLLQSKRDEECYAAFQKEVRQALNGQEELPEDWTTPAKDDPTSEGDIAFQLSSQPSASHSQLTGDLPVNILQETMVITEENCGSDNSQFTGSTINLQDLE